MGNKMNERLGDVRAVVTGAASGIGRSLALELARRGAQVLCADIDALGAERVVSEIERDDGGRAAAIRCDVGKLEDVEAMARFGAERFGAPANFIINNAGIGVGGQPIGEISMEDWRRTVDVNLWGVIHGCHVFVPELRARGVGSVINLASAAGFASAPRMAAYNVTKAGVVSLSETLAAELGDTSVRVSVVCPTFVKTAIADNPSIDDDAREMARRGMALTGRSPDRVARQILDGHERGTFMILPQVEAKIMHRLKRGLPALHLRMNTLLAKGIGGR